ncbi:hypothetical protein A3Q56_00384 [Intoshia linei]|uniref:THIF-type NAD/FAD binding fold domain-containing protein n=1 Tax=Intoshia linei TaxID=1819745 RepID=A0A177BE00_9BILA|nr:hypothetical protein A3Q56_00384 [Intoshia linei]
MNVNKFDRQTRIWTKCHQTMLNVSKVCVIGSNYLSAEDIGFITVIDDCVTTMDKLDKFFYKEYPFNKVNLSRCTALANCLKDLNHNTVIESIHLNNLDLIDEKIISDFDIIIITKKLTLANYASIVQMNKLYNTPYITASVFGVYGLIDFYFQNYLAFDVKVEFDYNLHNYFPDFDKIVNRIDFINQKDFDSKYELKDFDIDCIRKNIFKDNTGNWPNYKESLRWLFKCLKKPCASHNIFTFKDNERNILLSKLFNALNIFISQNNRYPIIQNFNLPDMHSSNDYFTELANFYQLLAFNDIKQFKSILNTLTQGENLNIDEEFLIYFVNHCKSANVLCSNCIHLTDWNKNTVKDIDIELDNVEYIICRNYQILQIHSKKNLSENAQVLSHFKKIIPQNLYNKFHLRLEDL